MRRIELDFHKGRSKRNRAMGWALLVFGLLVGVSLVIQHNKLKTQQQRIKTVLAQQHERQQGLSSNMDAKEIEPQLQGAAGVIEQLSFPWDKLFKTLESSMNEDVALLSVVPDVKGGTITLNVEARDWTAMLDYIRRLGEDKFFAGVHLVSHQIQQSDPQHPIRFVLSCVTPGVRQVVE